MNKTRKIKILFDAGPLVNGNRSGVGRTTEGLILALANSFPDEIELVGHYFDFMGHKQGIDLPKAPNIRYRRTVFVPGKVFNMLRRLGFWIPFELLTKERGDFHLFPGFVGWPSLFKTPSAPFIHDITYIDFPQYVNGPARFDLQTLMPRTIRRASLIITNSESSKSGLMREYKLRGKPVLVEPIPPVNALSLPKAEAQSRVKRLGIEPPFLLFLSNIEPRKNLIGLLNAYEQLDPKLQDKYSLVLTGGKGWRDDEILDKLKRLDSKKANVKLTGFVSDEDRAALFMEASMFIMPSHYEGFGMPLLEAMTYRTPLLASDIPVHHEVAKDAALYTGTSAGDIAKNITRLIEDESLRAKLVVSGTKRLKDFSWPKVAREVFAAVKETVR